MTLESDRQSQIDVSQLPVSRDPVLYGTIAAASEPGTAIGPSDSVAFSLIRLVGEGGMGLVYKALQKYPERVVALKVLKTNLITPRMLRRFSQEISILARLHHRGIAQLYCVGDTAAGLGGAASFIAMEFVDGQPITVHADRHRLNTRQRVELLANVCAAVGYAHNKGIVHRDLKPSNILIDVEGEPKIIDFGLALFVDTSIQASAITNPGEFVGTLEYMSPEQAKGTSREVDSRTDVYSLGVILYELLSARRPLDLSACSVSRAAGMVEQQEPARLSQNDRSLRGDIELIVHKAIAKERERRYESVAALADDLRRFLAALPIQARRPSHLYVASKFARRNWVFLCCISLVIASLIAGWFFTAQEALRANLAAQRLAQETLAAESRLADSQLAQADTLQMSGRYDESRALYEAAWDGFDKVGRSPLPAQFGLWDLDCVAAQPLRSILSDTHGLKCVAISPNSRWIALGWEDGSYEVRESLTNKCHIRGKVAGSIARVLFSESGGTFAAVSEASFHVWTTTEAHRIRTNIHGTGSTAPAAISDTSLAAVTSDGRFCFEPISENSSPSPLLLPDAILAVGLQGSEAVAITSDWRVLRISNSASEQVVGKLPTPTAFAVMISPDGKTLATQDSSSIRVFEADTLRELPPISALPKEMVIGYAGMNALLCFDLQDHKSSVISLTGKRLGTVEVGRIGAYASNGRFLLSTSATGELTLGCLLRDICRHLLIPKSEHPVAGILSPDGRAAVIGEADGQLRIIDTVLGKDLGSFDINARPREIATDAEGERVAITTSDRRLMIWDIVTNQKIGELSEPQLIRSFAFWPSGDRIALCLGDESQVRVYHQDSDHWSMQSLPSNLRPTLVAISAGAEPLLLVGSKTGCEIWKMGPTSEFRLIAADQGGIEQGTFSSGGDGIVASTSAGALVVWNFKDHGLTQVLSQSPLNPQICAGASPLAFVADPNELRAVDLETSRQLRQWPDGSRAMSVSSKGMRLLSINNREGATLFNFEIPAQIRSAFPRPTKNADGVANEVDQRKGLIESGIYMADANTIPSQVNNLRGANTLDDGYAYWAAGDLSAAQKCFRSDTTLNRGIRQLLIHSTESGHPPAPP